MPARKPTHNMTEHEEQAWAAKLVSDAHASGRSIDEEIRFRAAAAFRRDGIINEGDEVQFGPVIWYGVTKPEH